MEHPTITVDVLGTPYSILCRRREEDKHLTSDEFCDGYCDGTARKIILRDIEAEDESDPERVERLDVAYRRNMRHELIHAALHESGLNCECAWACNEEMVDWFALQFEKLLRMFLEAGAMGSDEIIGATLPNTPEASMLKGLSSLSSTMAQVKEVN